MEVLVVRALNIGGKSKVDNDMLIHTLGFEELATEWSTTQDLELKNIYTAFVKGMNAYADVHPEAIDEKNKIVLPITTKDINMHSMYVIFTRFIGGKDLGRVQQVARYGFEYLCNWSSKICFWQSHVSTEPSPTLVERISVF